MDWAKVIVWGVLFLLGWFMVGIAAAPWVGALLERKGREQWESGTGKRGGESTGTTMAGGAVPLPRSSSTLPPESWEESYRRRNGN